MDTGSSDIFLSSISCDSSCDRHDRYDPSGSKSAVDLHQTFNLTYGSEDTIVEEYSDTVSIAGLIVSHRISA